MKSKKRNPPRPVPVLTPSQEALLTAITESKMFTLDVVLARHRDTEDSRIFRELYETACDLHAADAMTYEEVASIVQIFHEARALHLQLAYDFAALLVRERGQQAVVQYLYNDIGRRVAAGIGAKSCL